MQVRSLPIGGFAAVMITGLALAPPLAAQEPAIIPDQDQIVAHYTDPGTLTIQEVDAKEALIIAYGTVPEVTPPVPKVFDVVKNIIGEEGDLSQTGIDGVDVTKASHLGIQPKMAATAQHEPGKVIDSAKIAMAATEGIGLGHPSSPTTAIDNITLSAVSSMTVPFSGGPATQSPRSPGDQIAYMFAIDGEVSVKPAGSAQWMSG